MNLYALNGKNKLALLALLNSYG